MLKTLQTLFTRTTRSNPLPAIPAGQRVYAIGDIHGRADLFATIIDAIEAEERTHPPAAVQVILLGDLIDRGPDSAGVLARVHDWAQRRRIRLIAGNHEDMLLKALDQPEALRLFLRHGGRETLLSYPLPAALLSGEADYPAIRDAILSVMPIQDLALLREAEDQIRIGDYLFVHAGIRPGVPLEDQQAADLRWIRQPFLDNAESHGCMVVHGHTITPAPEIKFNRIGLDTGAYQTGRLTALALQGTARWVIETGQDEDGRIHCRSRSVA